MLRIISRLTQTNKRTSGRDKSCRRNDDTNDCHWYKLSRHIPSSPVGRDCTREGYERRQRDVKESKATRQTPGRTGAKQRGRGTACWNNDRASQDLYVDIEKRPGKKCPLSVTLLSVALSWPCRVSRNESRFNTTRNNRAPRTDGSLPRRQILS